jgi:hypothetical protein
MKVIGWIAVCAFAFFLIRSGTFSDMKASGERFFCSYKSAAGECQSEDEHIRQVARDAAADAAAGAVADWASFCGNYMNRTTNPQCAAFRPN